LVGYLCHDSCTESGGIFEALGGWISRVRWERTKGVFFQRDHIPSPEEIRAKWDVINDWKDSTNPTSGGEAIASLVSHLQEQQKPTSKL